MTGRPLDLDAVEAFVRIAELDSFTRAAEAMRTTQAAVSLKLKRLEERLGCRLIVRTPRYVQLSVRGAAFLQHARELLEAHDRALAEFAGARQRLTIGISDHVAGPELPALIARMNAQDPQLLIDIRIGSSGDLLQSFDRRELDTVIVRLHAGRSDGEFLPKKNSAGLRRQAGSIVPASPCRWPRLPSPAACVRWPGGFSMRQACPGRRFSSAAALRRSLPPLRPGSAWLHWRRACCRLARLR